MARLLWSLLFATVVLSCVDQEAGVELRPAFKVDQAVYTVDDCDDVIFEGRIENPRPLDRARNTDLEIATIQGQLEESVLAVTATICANRSDDQVWLKANRTN